MTFFVHEHIHVENHICLCSLLVLTFPMGEVDTYSTFIEENRQKLAGLPSPAVAKLYYSEDPYLFDEFQASYPPGSRRPPCETLLDVFSNICMDEAEHVKTMAACQDYARDIGAPVESPHYKQASEMKTEQTRKLFAVSHKEESNNVESQANQLRKDAGLMGDFCAHFDLPQLSLTNFHEEGGW